MEAVSRKCLKHTLISHWTWPVCDLFRLSFLSPGWPRLSVMSGSCFQHYRIGKTCVEFPRKCRRCRPSITRQLIAIPEEFAQPIVPPTAWYSLATFSGHRHRLLILGVHSNQDQTQNVPRPFVQCGHHRCVVSSLVPVSCRVCRCVSFPAYLPVSASSCPKVIEAVGRTSLHPVVTAPTNTCCRTHIDTVLLPSISLGFSHRPIVRAATAT